MEGATIYPQLQPGVSLQCERGPFSDFRNRILSALIDGYRFHRQEALLLDSIELLLRDIRLRCREIVELSPGRLAAWPRGSSNRPLIDQTASASCREHAKRAPPCVFQPWPILFRESLGTINVCRRGSCAWNRRLELAKSHRRARQRHDVDGHAKKTCEISHFITHATVRKRRCRVMDEL